MCWPLGVSGQPLEARAGDGTVVDVRCGEPGGMGDGCGAGGGIAHVEGGYPSWHRPVVAPADGQPSEVRQVTLAELVVVTRFPSVSSTRTTTE